MTTKPNKKRNTFKQLELRMTCVIAADLALFLLFLLGSGFGIGWLKVLTAIFSIALSGLAIGFLVLIGEHTKARSRWLFAAFGSIAAVVLVSLILGYPAPAVVAAS